MTTMTEEATITQPVPLTEKPDMPMGATLRATNVATGQSVTGRVVHTYSATDFGIRLDQSIPWNNSHTIAGTMVESGQVVIERLADPEPIPAPVPVIPEITRRTRVRDRRSDREGITGYQGTNAVNGENRWFVYWNVGRNSTVPESRLEALPVNPTPLPFAVGQRVNVADYGEKGTITGLEPLAYDGATQYYVVMLDGGMRVRLVARQMEALDSADNLPMPDVGEIVNPIEVGTEGLFTNGRKVVIVDKADITDIYLRRSRRSYFSSDRYAAGKYSNPEHGADPFFVDVSNFLTIPDLSALTAEDRLRALQVMIHRVASYEAEQRNWCDEVNGALRSLGDLLPPDLQSVDRDLGRRITKRNLFSIPGVTPMPAPEPVTVDLRVTYEATGGFSVTVALSDVALSAQPEVGESVDAAVVNRSITTDLVIQAIRAKDGELPQVAADQVPAWALVDYRRVPATA